MDYLQLTLSLKDEFHELLIAELYEMDFEGFEQEDDKLIASIPAPRFDDTKREEIEKMLTKLGGFSSILSEEMIAPQNWNETWERSIKPQQLGPFYVHPTWTEYEGGDGTVELIIDPKMAFGTGYHATTRLILEWLPELIEEGNRVLDAGTGTGILSIAALKLGAQSAFGFDIDEWSKTNAEENIYLNKVNHFQVELGSLDVVPQNRSFDTVLANINKNALKELVPGLIGRLEDGGRLLLSGLLTEDEEDMLALESVQALNHVETRTEGEWIAILFTK